MLNKIAERKLHGMLGLAAKAGRVQSGEFCAEKSVRAGRARLCIAAADASEQTKKHFRDMCSYRGIPFDDKCIDRDKLGHMIGRGMRVVVTVEDTGFAENLIRLIEGGNADES